MTNSNHISSDRREEAVSSAPATERAALREVWDLAAGGDEAPTFSDAEIEHTWKTISAFSRAENSQPAIESRRPTLRLITGRRFWMAAAAVLAICALGYAWWMQPIEHYAPNGRQLVANLPDGSVVQLNSGSTLKYPRRFDGVRRAHLDGEAFFEVAHDAAPFILTTFNAQVEVLGTKFNVKAWENSVAPSTRVSLLEGSVKFSAIDTTKEVVFLKPGETRRLSSKTLEIMPADTVIISYALAWKEGDFIFMDEQLGVILEDFERRFGIQVDMENERLLMKAFTFVGRQPASADSVLNSLCEALNLKYSKTSRGVVIYSQE